MSWLRSSPLRQSLTRTGSSVSQSSGIGRNRPIAATAAECDPRACYDSFCKHWQQAYDIIQKSDSQRPPTHDDVLGVVSHLDFMVTLLLVELHNCNKICLPSSNQSPPAPCLEFLLSENLLDKLYEWGISTGRYSNAVRLEQLKLYELLVSHSRHQLLCHEPFLRPLLKILASSQDEIFPPDVEKRLVILLNQLCVVLMQNVHLLDLFFFSSNQHGQGHCSTNFIIFSLLIPYVHREGSLGHQARDALLLCMSLSHKNSNIGTYIAQYSSMCPLLVTGLGGLYSRLPSAIEINSIDWHRITPDDVTEISELTLFMNSLEFCNAVVQVAHDLIKQELLDFMYQGFIVPVLGPSILQTNIESQISAMAYLDLILRSITEPGLIRAFVKFLLDTEKFDGQRILDSLIDRISSPDPNLSMVTLSLFDTILGLHCEDLMLELILKFLLPGKHIPISYRHKINKIDPYTKSSDFFLDLTPDVMKRSKDLKKKRHPDDNNESVINGNSTSTTGLGTRAATATTSLTLMPSPPVSKTIGANWNHYGLLSGDSLYSNYHAYLFDAHTKIAQCQVACQKWSSSYKYQKWPTKHRQNFEKITELVRNFFMEFSNNLYTTTNNNEAQIYECDKNKYDSLQSIGESSGYESFKWRPEDDNNDVSSGLSSTLPNNTLSMDFDDNGYKKTKASSEPFWRLSRRKDLTITDLDFSEDLFTQGTISLGPFLTSIWGKLQTFTSNSLYVNLHLTGLITRMAWYPLPLINSLLLRPDIMTTSDTPSFHQVLRILKQQIDAELPATEDSLEIIDVARSYLVDREFRLINARKSSAEQISKNSSRPSVSFNQTTYANISATTPLQLTPSSSYDPFKRNDNKRKSISKSITSMFTRKQSASTGLSQIYAFFTGNSTTTQSNVNSQMPSIAASSAVTAATINQQINQNNIPLHDRMALTSNNQSGVVSGGSNSSTFQLPQNQTMSQILTLNSNNSMGGNSEPASLDSMSSMTSTIGAIANTSGTERTRDLALCAVLLDEWLKELAAISQEQSIVMISDNL